MPWPPKSQLGLVEHVHRAALALGATGGLAKHLGHARAGVHAAGEGVAVVAVGEHDRVIGVDGGKRADGAGFLADVQVTEAADLGLLVGLGAADLELADEEHVAEPFVDGGDGEGIDGVRAAGTGRAAVACRLRGWGRGLGRLSHRPMVGG